jgi:L-alanine-DL-glutamate epimerase-like enolase superfamily enzyme
MKVGRDPAADPERVAAARQAIGAACELFVDANGAYSCRQAIDLARDFASARVTWFEEPVSSDDLEGLRFVREHRAPGVRVVAGEYGFDPWYFRQMLQAKAVDIVTPDVTRCCGITGFLKAEAIADALTVPLSSHCAPAAHLHVDCAVRRLFYLEYFYDHARIESMLFDGVAVPVNGELTPDLSRPGLGFEFRHEDAEKFKL